MSLGHPIRSWHAVLTACLCAISLLWPATAPAQTGDTLAQLKIAPDLLTTVGASVVPAVPWARLLDGELLVRALSRSAVRCTTNTHRSTRWP